MYPLKLKIPYRKQVFISIVFAALAPLCILGAFSYWTYTNEFSEKMDIMTQSIANQTRDRVDSVLSSVKEYYQDIFNKSEVKWLIDSESISYQNHQEVLAAGAQLRGAPSFVEYVTGYSLIDLEKDWVITNSGMYRYWDAVNKNDVEGLLFGENENIARLSWINHINQPLIRQKGNLVNMSGYLLLLRLPAISTTTEQALIVNLDPGNLQWLVKANLEESSVVVLDQNAEIFVSSNQTLALYCRDHFEDVKKQRTPELVTTDDGMKYRIATASSVANGLVFIVGYDQPLVTEGADRILLFIVVIIAVILLLLILSRLGTIWIYRPVSRLINYFNDSDTSGDVFEKIESSVEQLVISREAMEQVIGQQREMLTELFIHRLTRGELTSCQIDENVQRLHLRQYQNYSILAIRLHIDKSISADSIDEDALRILILEHLPVSLRKYLYFPPVNNGNAVLFLMADDDQDKLDEKLLKLYQELNAFIAAEFHLRLLAGISAAFHHISQARYAFLESVEAMKNGISPNSAFEDGHNSSLIYYADISKHNICAPIYDELTEQEVRIALDQCNYELAVSGMNSFIDNLAGWASARHENALYLHRFLSALLSVLCDAGLSVGEVFRNEESNLFKQMQNIYETDELKRFFVGQVIGPSIQALESYRENSAPIARITALVKERKGDITLAECADQLGYHSSYIWRLLKKQAGITFSAFVAREKIALAKEMLIETDRSVTEIAEALNYTNSQNFIRFFSKHEGMTPGKYRGDNKPQ